ncbi:MAG TPA: MoaD/ThiS family protein [Thermoanaerobaculia bacterium]|nr:MoaD/ThiS family protein [Thermoanaerobaculia bacterium]
MQVRVLYFASFRDAAGHPEEIREIPPGTRVADLWEILSREVPAFGRFPGMPPAAVNRLSTVAFHTLEDGDEVAYLPPVAGG